MTGGLFLGEDIEELESTAEFPLTQDQRHTIRGRATYQFSPSTWIAVGGSYGSGLPFEDFEGTPEEAAEQFGQEVVDRVNFETGRVRPNASLDIAAGVTVGKWAKSALRLQGEVRNLTNRFDVINFAGLFSGTALAAPRSFSVRFRWDRQNPVRTLSNPAEPCYLLLPDGDDDAPGTAAGRHLLFDLARCHVDD